MTTPREHTTVAVIGGGPGGAVAAAALAREGIDVIVFERETFPRYHIGESLLTALIPILEFLGLHEQVEAHGFVRKHGGFFTLKSGAAPGHIDFRRLSEHGHSYQVIRSEFDHLLLRHAAASGAAVHEATAVTDLEFSGERPVALRWRQAGVEGRTTFDHLVDASGLGGIMATRYLRNRTFQEAFANVAVGSYWRGYTPYRTPDGRVQTGEFFMEALDDGAGWAWAIPLHDGTLSVGVVVHSSHYRELRAAGGGAEEIYRSGLRRAPEITGMLAAATRTQDVHTWQDFSYIADRFSGPGYRLVGDAAAFIDPLFSTGVHMAMLGALSAAASLAAELRGEVPPAVAAGFHDGCVRKAYTRFAVIVAGMYKQIREQDTTVLYGIDGADFRRAFELVMPVLGGAADLGGTVSPEVFRRAVDFMVDMTLERAQIGGSNPAVRVLLAAGGGHEDLAATAETAIDGHYMRLERGALGLAAVGLAAREIDERGAALRDRLAAAVKDRASPRR